jgi:nifR3 family TIM-barrel protein
MRLIARRHGAPYALHELVLDKLVLQPGKLQRKILDLDPEDHPVGGQLMGSEPRQFAEAAALMAENGFDVVDINFGCPVRKVLGRCRGGYLLSDPPTAIEIMRQVRAAVSKSTPVTVKMRRGMDDSAESERKFFEVFDAAWGLELDAVTVHGRTVAQKYVGQSNWDFLRRVKRYAGDRTVLGSGDLFSAYDIVRMLNETGVDGVTVARGCIGNPWIFEDAMAMLTGQALPEPPSVPQQGRIIQEHFALSLRHHGEYLAPRMMRKFGIKYSEMHPESLIVRDAFIRASTREEWSDVLNTWYDPTRSWAPTTRRAGPGALIAAGACEC